MAIKLGRLYVEICKCGDVAYFDWNIRFRCDFLKKSDGGIPSGESGVTEAKDEKARQMELIHQEIDKLENRLETLKEIYTIRQNHPALNYFTSKQCLLLQKFLYDRRNYALLHRVFSLLRMVPGSENLKATDLRDLLTMIANNRDIAEKSEVK